MELLVCASSGERERERRASERASEWTSPRRRGGAWKIQPSIRLDIIMIDDEELAETSEEDGKREIVLVAASSENFDGEPKKLRRVPSPTTPTSPSDRRARVRVGFWKVPFRACTEGAARG